jgi:hypothetical protein
VRVQALYAVCDAWSYQSTGPLASTPTGGVGSNDDIADVTTLVIASRAYFAAEHTTHGALSTQAIAALRRVGVLVGAGDDVSD